MWPGNDCPDFIQIIAAINCRGGNFKNKEGTWHIVHVASFEDDPIKTLRHVICALSFKRVVRGDVVILNFKGSLTLFIIIKNKGHYKNNTVHQP
jgi:hypothetical protein